MAQAKPLMPKWKPANAMTHTPHRFGGEHTELKVDVLKRYLTAYMTVMKKKPYFTLWYIDAFAGSGTRIETQPASHDLFGFTPEQNKIFEGSAKVALSLDRQFDKYRFIETHKGRRYQLNELIAKYPALDAECLEGDANLEIQKLLAGAEWLEKSNNRGVIFLDPYGLSVDHTTIKAIARTGKLDVWYLFRLEGLYRQAAHDPSRIDLQKDECLSRTLGREDWRDLFYQKHQVEDIFGGRSEIVRRISYKEMPAVIKAELERVFPSVSEPLSLPLHKSPPQFLLYFCVSNPSKAAIAPARRIADHIIGLGNSSHC